MLSIIGIILCEMYLLEGFHLVLNTKSLLLTYSSIAGSEIVKDSSIARNSPLAVTVDYVHYRADRFGKFFSNYYEIEPMHIPKGEYLL